MIFFEREPAISSLPKVAIELIVRSPMHDKMKTNEQIQNKYNYQLNLTLLSKRPILGAAVADLGAVSQPDLNIGRMASF